MQAIESTTEPEGPEHGARSPVDPLRNAARICLVVFAPAFVGFFGSPLWQLHQRADPTWAAPTLGHLAREAGMARAVSLLTLPILTGFSVPVLREAALARADAAG